jgi:hypothetical protein
MYSAGTFASSGPAAATIASRDTSAKGGRARLRGSCTVGSALMGMQWGCACMLNDGGWEATWSMLLATLWTMTELSDSVPWRLRYITFVAGAADISSTEIEMSLPVPFRSFLCRPSVLG